jgi:hypothetical protein
MNTFDILPQQEEPTNGWVVDYSFLQAVKDGADARGEWVSTTGIEAVLLTAFDLLSAYFPKGLEART